MKAILSLFFVFLSFTSWGQDKRVYLTEGLTPYPHAVAVSDKSSCGDVDLVSGLGKVHRQQGHSCHAYAATDLLGFGQKEEYSPYHLASLSSQKAPSAKNSKKASGFAQNYVKEDLALGIKYGLCAKTTLPDMEALQTMIETERDQFMSKDEECSFDDVDIMNEEVMSKVLFKLKGGRLPWEKVKVILEKARTFNDWESIKKMYEKSSSDGDFLQKLAIKQCKKLDINHTKTKVVDKILPHQMDGEKPYVMEQDRSELVKELNTILDKNQPVAITYFGVGLITEANQGPYPHASVVAGRSWNPEKKECQYLVKNSWGESWTPDSELRAQKSSRNPGYFIVSEKDLMERMYGISYLVQP